MMSAFTLDSGPLLRLRSVPRPPRAAKVCYRRCQYAFPTQGTCPILAAISERCPSVRPVTSIRMYNVPVVPCSAITRRGTTLRLWKQFRTRASAPGSASALTRRQSACVAHSSRASSSAGSWIMGSVPHRDFTWIERTAVPAFSESRAGNRPDPVDEGSHDENSNTPWWRGTTSHPPAIHDVVLIRAGARLLRGEEHDELRNLGGLEPALEALALVDLGFRLRRHPLLQLTLRHDPAGRDGVDADPVGAEVACERACQTQHGRL